MKNLSLLGTTLLLLVLSTFSNSYAKEKSMWQKFVDFFSPSPIIEGEGPLYDELRELDKKINKVEGKYSRERRPGNKTRLRKELDKLNANRNKLIEKIKEEENKTNVSKFNDISTNETNSNTHQVFTYPIDSCKFDTLFIHDTIFIKDTTIIHDTLYVIIANKPSETSSKDSTLAPNNN